LWGDILIPNLSLEADTMSELLLSELIEQTTEAVRSFGHSRSTDYQYQIAWGTLTRYFFEHHQVLFSKPLAQEYVLEQRAKFDAGTIREWRYKLDRIAVRLLIEFSEQGALTWHHAKPMPITTIHASTFICLQQEYVHHLTNEGIRIRTIQSYETVSRHFFAFLEQNRIQNIAAVHLNDVRLFIPWIAKRYRSTSMRTVFSALRSFLRFTKLKGLTQEDLERTIPSGWGRKTTIIPTITRTEEQNLLASVDRSTPSGKRNYAMLLLALRTGLRSVDILHLKLEDIHWRTNTIEIIQEKTQVPLVLPLLTDVGNAIADYLLHGRPESSLPYVFLRTLAPFQNLSSRSACYAISCKIMKAAGIRQGKADRKGFHCLRHSVAARLLSEETPLPVISSILGHRNKDSAKVYLSTDLDHLRDCALSLVGIEIAQEELR